MACAALPKCGTKIAVFPGDSPGPRVTSPLPPVGGGSAMRKTARLCTLLAALLVSAIFFVNCGGSKSASNSMATLNVRVSDPATCSGPQGAFSHIYVTITDVQIHASGTAGKSDAGWIDLTPALSQN